MHIVGRGWNVGAHITPEAGMDLAVVIAMAAGMDVQHPAILHTAARHLRQHLSTKQLLLSRVGLACEDAIKERAGCGPIQVGRPGGGMAVIGRGTTQLTKALPGMAQSEQISWPARAILAVHLSQLLDVLAESIEFRIND